MVVKEEKLISKKKGRETKSQIRRILHSVEGDIEDMVRSTAREYKVDLNVAADGVMPKLSEEMVSLHNDFLARTLITIYFDKHLVSSPGDKYNDDMVELTRFWRRKIV